MNHLPLPRDATIGHFPIPLLTDSLEDCGSFEDYPKRHGWALTLRGRVLEFQHDQRVISDETQIGKFLQTWLYFGLLHEFGFMSDFVVFQQASGHEQGAKLLTSACLSELMPARAQLMRQQVQNMTASRLEEFAQHLQKCLQMTWTTLRWLVPSAGALLSATCLSTATLAETLEYWLRSVLEGTSISLTVSISWRIQPRYDFGLPLLALMRQNGWCPHRLAHLDRDGNDSIGRLWYFANIPPPLRHQAHDACSSEACRHLQVDPSTYSTAHSSSACDCAFRGPDLQVLGANIAADRIPLVSVDNGFVHVIEASAETPFVAISHVWADGMGNQTDNTLPSCVLGQLQECVNAVMCKEEANGRNDNVPFWIDTLSLPRQPMELRRKGIANLSEAFKMASVVLVMDSYLRDVDSTAISVMEVIARIAVSNWTLRLWTFSEGRLAKRIVFQFRDCAINPLALISGGVEEGEKEEGEKEKEEKQQQPPQIDVFSGSPSDFIMVDIMKMYNATTISPAAIDMNNLATLRSALKTRSTSWQPDEALCLGYILGLDMVKLLEASESEKMQTFWSLVGLVPLGIAFSDARTKIRARGYRWAPASFTGNLEAEFWLGPPSLSNNLAVPSPIGLVSELPALFFNDVQQTDYDGTSSHLRARNRLVQRFRSPTEVLGPLEFKHENGHWYHCVIDDPAWHQDTAASNYLNEESKFAILLADSLPHNHQQDPSTKGLLVTYQDGGDGGELPVSVTVHFHVIVNLCTDIEDQYMDYLMSQANKLKASHPARFTTAATNVLDADRKAVFDLVWDLWTKPSAVHDKELHTLARRVHQQRVMQDDVTALMISCCDYVAWFLRVGEWYRIRDGKNIMQWCID